MWRDRPFTQKQDNEKSNGVEVGGNGEGEAGQNLKKGDNIGDSL